MKKTLSTFMVLITLFSVLSAMVINTKAETIKIVTNENDSGVGSLRQVIAEAEDGDTITFAEDVTYITLESVINFDVSITIDGGVTSGGKSKVTIDGNNKDGILENNFLSCDVILRGLTLKNGMSEHYYGAVFVADLIAINCDFINNKGTAILAYFNIVLEECTFKDNIDGALSCGFGYLVAKNCVFTGNIGYDTISAKDITVINCIFNDNTGGAILWSSSYIIAINSSFISNKTDKIEDDFFESAGVIYANDFIYLIHSTIANNIGGGLSSHSFLWEYEEETGLYRPYKVEMPIYLFNSIITGNKMLDGVTDGNIISGILESNGKNLIENGEENTFTKIFRTNQDKGGYIYPLNSIEQIDAYKDIQYLQDTICNMLLDSQKYIIYGNYEYFLFVSGIYNWDYVITEEGWKDFLEFINEKPGTTMEELIIIWADKAYEADYKNIVEQCFASLQKDLLGVARGDKVTYGAVENVRASLLPYSKGDVNGDGEITIIDAIEIFKHLAGKQTIEKSEEIGFTKFYSADIDCDGEITIKDAIMIFKHLAGKSTI